MSVSLANTCFLACAVSASSGAAAAGAASAGLAAAPAAGPAAFSPPAAAAFAALCFLRFFRRARLLLLELAEELDFEELRERLFFFLFFLDLERLLDLLASPEALLLELALLLDRFLAEGGLRLAAGGDFERRGEAERTDATSEAAGS
mmetsp:Transcript_51626/g.139120  ORF Transcript_51626/g.139120 Transcript_51626/m.139120 type:complete len:148 (-) Transcript_51626:431-874(-)